MKAIKNYLQKKYSHLLIWLFVPIVVITSFSHHRWVKPERVIDFDVKSYYAYLPAFFIHHDLSLKFIDENPKEYGKWFWPVITPTGKKCIVTSMGLSFMYAPFFLAAHAVAPHTNYSANGYSVPYTFALHFSALFYLIIGLFFLRKLLLKYFSQLIVFITIIVVFLGTNLFYYTAYVAPMSHAYNFALIAIFLFYVDKWHENSTLKNTIILGLLSGLISLIRPTNIIVLLVFFFWNTYSFSSVMERTKLFLSKYRLILIMMFFFILVWAPQLAYWKFVSGKLFYFSYGNLDAKFYWNNPQIFDILFSYRKGWWVYTPVMFVASLGIFMMFRHMKQKLVAILIFLIVNIYVQASWWCWWFGGSFGLRAFVDSYSILAIPLAVVIQQSLKLKWKGYIIISVIGLLSYYNIFQTKQYQNQAIHYWWMSRTGYWKNFLKSSPAPGYWETVPVPDYNKARKGVYVAKNLIERFDGYKNVQVEPLEIASAIKNSLVQKPKYERYARKFSISVDSAITIEAWNIYERKRSIDEFIRPIVAEKITDSLLIDTVYLRKHADLILMDADSKKTTIYNRTLAQLKHEKF